MKGLKAAFLNYWGVFKGDVSVLGGEVVIPDMDGYGSYLASRQMFEMCSWVCALCILCNHTSLGPADWSFPTQKTFISDEIGNKCKAVLCSNHS